jgi:3-keto-5-aminohexanoate cleavage enzyme
MINHLPPRVKWNLSVMDQMQWRLHAQAIAMGGHVRVGWEDNPCLPNGEVACSNAELVEVAVQMARAVGREVATPAEARVITGLST